VVCLSVSFVHCAQTAKDIDPISFVYNNPSMSLLEHVKICLTSITPSSLNFIPKWPAPADMSVADIRWQIVAESSEIAQWSQWRAYRKPPSLFRMVPSLIPNDLPFSQNGGRKCTAHEQLHHVCFHLANMIEEWCRLLPNYFGPCFLCRNSDHWALSLSHLQLNVSWIREYKYRKKNMLK